jgi:LPXTG-site transpeptidase (sortase) family protein
MARSTRRSHGRSGAATHGLAWFVLGLLAVVTGLAFAGPRSVPGLASEAAERAAEAAAVRMTLERDVSPPTVPAAPARTVQPLLPDDQRELLLRPKGATRVVVPSVGIDALVSSVGYTFRDGQLQYDVPKREAGHYVGTAAPGQPGNVVIGGHVVNRGAAAVFAPLPELRAGEVIEVYRGDEVFRYSVVEIRIVAADATAVMSQTQDATLTLITCFPDDGYRERLVVIGKLL